MREMIIFPFNSTTIFVLFSFIQCCCLEVDIIVSHLRLHSRVNAVFGREPHRTVSTQFFVEVQN